MARNWFSLGAVGDQGHAVEDTEGLVVALRALLRKEVVDVLGTRHGHLGSVALPLCTTAHPRYV